MFEKTKRFLDSFLDSGLPGFDLSVYQGGKPILRHMGGYSDLENKIKIDGSERYNIYSCSKPITCTAAMQLFEKGLFSLDDKLSLYMPEFENMSVKTEGGIERAKNPILIKHLFEMTAGLSYNTSSPEIKRCIEETSGACPTREAIKYIAREPLLFEPGERWHYSLCHDVLAALVEVLSGERFEDYVSKNIFEPLSMTNTTFLLPEEELSSVAEQYRFKEGVAVNIGKKIVEYKLGREFASGGAGCVSTTDDYIKFLEGLRRGMLVSPETLTLMTTSRLTEEQRRTYTINDKYDYALGMRCPKATGSRRDFGWGGAAGAFLLVDREREVSLYFSTHLLSSPVSSLRYMIYEFIKMELFGEGSDENIKKELEENYKYNFTY